MIKKVIEPTSTFDVISFSPSRKSDILKIIQQLTKLYKQKNKLILQLNLNIKSQNKYKSSCGGITSLTMISLLSYIFINRFINIINKQDYTIKHQNLQSRDPKYRIMNSQNFMMAVKISDPFNTYFPTLNKTAYNVSVQQYVLQTIQNGQKVKSLLKEYTLERCTENHFKYVNFEDQQQVKNQLPNFLCLPLEYELFLQGTYNSELFYYPKIQVSLCQTENCYTQDQYQQVTSNSSQQITISTLIQSNIFMSNKSEDFLFSYINSDFYLTNSFSTWTEADLFFKYNKIIMDDNLLSVISDIQEVHFWSFQLLDFREITVNNTFNQNQHTVHNTNTLFQINFRLSLEQEITTKTAYKLDQLMSYLGGMLKFFSAIFGLIAVQYNILALKLSLANLLYQFNIPSSNKEGRMQFSYDKLLNYIQFQINRVDELLHKLKTHTQQVVKMSNITRAWSNLNSCFKEEKPQVNDQKLSQHDVEIYTQNLIEFKEHFLEKLVQKIVDTRKQLKLGINFILYLLMCCTCYKKIWMTRQLIVQCNQMISRDLDIVNILSKIQQIDKLKQVLLDQDQISVFNYIPKPIIHVDKKYQILTEDQSVANHLIIKANQQKRSRVIKNRIQFNKPKKFLKIYDSYINLKTNNSQLNSRLILMLGSTIEMIFQKYHEIDTILQQKGHFSTNTARNIAASPIQSQKISQNKMNYRQAKIFQQVKAKALDDEEEIEYNQ